MDRTTTISFGMEVVLATTTTTTTATTTTWFGVSGKGKNYE